jgi:hypothetical protein
MVTGKQREISIAKGPGELLRALNA